MSKVRCINTKGYALTNRGEYELISEENGFVKIINDNGFTARYNKELFQNIRGPREPRPEPVVQPPPPIRTERNVIESVRVNNGNITFTDIDNSVITIQSVLVNAPTSISCGIHQIHELNTIINRLHAQVPGNDDRLELKKRILKLTIIDHITNRTERGEIYLMSTNTGYDEDLLPVLDEISHFQSEEVVNPNSDNLIKMWGFYKSRL